MKKKISIIVFIIGLITLAAGGAYLYFNLPKPLESRDAEYLVEKGTWVDKEDKTSIIWTFTEIGKGTVTTNNGQDTYDFIWNIEDDKLRIETDWLYTLNDEFTYSIDRTDNTLSLKDEAGGRNLTLNAITKVENE